MIPADLTPAILQGHVLDVLASMPEKSVHCVVTSPPFWGLRRYDVCGCSVKRNASQSFKTWGGVAEKGESCGQVGVDDPRTRKDPDPDCPWCHGTGEIPGMETLWGGDPFCDHVFRERRYYTGSGASLSAAEAFSEPGPANSERIKRARWREDATCSKCQAWRGALGLEPSPQLYVEHMVEVLRAVRRVLRDDGTVWLEIGDTYVTHPAGLTGAKRWKASGLNNRDQTGAEQAGSFDKRAPGGLAEGNQVLVPHRVAIALQDDGWVVRQTYIFSRPNPMPESVKNRGTSSHSYIFQLAKSNRYYYDRENGREPMAPSSAKRLGQPTFWDQKGGDKDYANGVNPSRSARHALENLAQYNDGGRNILSVWRIPTQAFTGKHYATFPIEIPRRCISITTSDRGCCPECGAQFARVTEVDYEILRGSSIQDQPKQQDRVGNGVDTPRGFTVAAAANRLSTTVGWTPTCDHYPDPCDRCGKAWVHRTVLQRASTMNIRVRDAKKGVLGQKSGLGGDAADATEEETAAYDTQEGSRVVTADASWPGCSCRSPLPATVLDIFCGSGTTLVAARRLQRRSVGIDLSQFYVDMARRRVEEETATLAPAFAPQRSLAEFAEAPL